MYHLVHMDDVGVPQMGKNLGFLALPRQPLRVAAAHRQHLDRDIPVERQLTRSIPPPPASAPGRGRGTPPPGCRRRFSPETHTPAVRTALALRNRLIRRRRRRSHVHPRGFGPQERLSPIGRRRLCDQTSLSRHSVLPNSPSRQSSTGLTYRLGSESNSYEFGESWRNAALFYVQGHFRCCHAINETVWRQSVGCD